MKDSRARLAAMAVGAATTVVLIFTWLAHANPSQRPDVFLLAGVAVIQVVVAAAWAAPWPRMPRLAVLSYGVLLIAVAARWLARSRPADRLSGPPAWAPLSRGLGSR
jgi:hypothetical protein